MTVRYRIGDLALQRQLGVAFNIFRDNQKSLLALAFITCLPFFITYYVVLYGNVFARLNHLLGRELLSWQAGYWIGYGATLVLWYATWVVLSAAVSYLVANRAIGISLSPLDALRRCKECGWELFKTAGLLAPLVVSFYVVWGFLFSGLINAIAYGGSEEQMAVTTVLYIVGAGLLVLVVWLLLRYLLAITVVVLERTSGRGALSRSAQLMHGFYGKGLLLWLGVQTLSVAIGVAAGLVSTAYSAWFISAAVHYILYTFFYTAITMLYFSSRSRHESLDRDLASIPAMEA